MVAIDNVLNYFKVHYLMVVMNEMSVIYHLIALMLVPAVVVALDKMLRLLLMVKRCMLLRVIIDKFVIMGSTHHGHVNHGVCFSS